MRFHIVASLKTSTDFKIVGTEIEVSRMAVLLKQVTEFIESEIRKEPPDTKLLSVSHTRY